MCCTTPSRRTLACAAGDVLSSPATSYSLAAVSTGIGSIADTDAVSSSAMQAVTKGDVVTKGKRHMDLVNDVLSAIDMLMFIPSAIPGPHQAACAAVKEAVKALEVAAKKVKDALTMLTRVEDVLHVLKRIRDNTDCLRDERMIKGLEELTRELDEVKRIAKKIEKRSVLRNMVCAFSGFGSVRDLAERDAEIKEKLQYLLTLYELDSSGEILRRLKERRPYTMAEAVEAEVFKRMQAGQSREEAQHEMMNDQEALQRLGNTVCVSHNEFAVFAKEVKDTKCVVGELVDQVKHLQDKVEKVESQHDPKPDPNMAKVFRDMLFIVRQVSPSKCRELVLLMKTTSNKSVIGPSVEYGIIDYLDIIANGLPACVTHGRNFTLDEEEGSLIIRYHLAADSDRNRVLSMVQRNQELQMQLAALGVRGIGVQLDESGWQLAPLLEEDQERYKGKLTADEGQANLRIYVETEVAPGCADAHNLQTDVLVRLFGGSSLLEQPLRAHRPSVEQGKLAVQVYDLVYNLLVEDALGRGRSALDEVDMLSELPTTDNDGVAESLDDAAARVDAEQGQHNKSTQVSEDGAAQADDACGSGPSSAIDEVHDLSQMGTAEKDSLVKRSEDAFEPDQHGWRAQQTQSSTQCSTQEFHGWNTQETQVDEEEEGPSSSQVQANKKQKIDPANSSVAQ